MTTQRRILVERISLLVRELVLFGLKKDNLKKMIFTGARNGFLKCLLEHSNHDGFRPYFHFFDLDSCICIGLMNRGSDRESAFEVSHNGGSSELHCLRYIKTIAVKEFKDVCKIKKVI